MVAGLKFDGHAERRDQRPARLADVFHEVALFVGGGRGVGYDARRHQYVGAFEPACRDVLQVDVEAQHAAAEIEGLVDAQVELPEGREPLRIVTCVVVVGAPLRIPGRDERRLCLVVRGIGRSADPAQARSDAPRAGQIVGAAQVDHVAVVPGRGDVAALAVAVLAAEERRRADEVDFAGDLPASRQFGAVGAAFGRRDERFGKAPGFPGAFL